MAKHRFGHLPSDVRHTAETLGFNTVIVAGGKPASVKVFRSSRRDRRRSRRDPIKRLYRIKHGNQGLHIVEDAAHATFAREQLLNSAGELDIISEREWPDLQRAWSRVTEDAGVPFPTKREKREENWGRWADAVREQVANANDHQIITYFAKMHDIRNKDDCPVCGG